MRQKYQFIAGNCLDACNQGSLKKQTPTSKTSRGMPEKSDNPTCDIQGTAKIIFSVQNVVFFCQLTFLFDKNYLLAKNYLLSLFNLPPLVYCQRLTSQYARQFIHCKHLWSINRA
jgi:hypothetical protein